jgi:hypothetical protein
MQDHWDSLDHLQLQSERDALGTPSMRMMGAPGRVCCEHCGWMVHTIGSTTCMSIYAAKLLYHTPQCVLGIDAFGDLSFLFLACR